MMTLRWFRRFEEVRRSGAVNMLDRRGVQGVAAKKSLYALAVVCEDAAEYAAILHGYGDWSLRGEQQKVEAQRRGAAAALMEACGGGYSVAKVALAGAVIAEAEAAAFKGAGE